MTDPSPTASQPNPGSPEETLPRRFGKYTLLRRMATGGMAEIYLSLQRSVAGFEKLIVIKRILPGMTQDRGFIDMLLHEARVAATLSHPNIVQTIDVGQVDGAYFIALEHVHGEDLRSIVRQMKKRGVAEFPIEHALSIILGMCAGLAYAHERRDLDGTPLSIVHRDISPQNVIVGFAGDVKVVDFGVAKSGAQSGLENTKSGQLKGKVPYMSPEQARGEDVDWRSDIFAIGIMLFELTTGKRLFKGRNEFETLKLILEREYPRPSWVSEKYSPGLEAIVLRALQKDRALRYQSAREMQADLEAFVRDEKLPVSSIALAEFMKMLFEEKLAAQKEALMQGRQLADVIAAQIVSSERTSAGSGTESGRPSSLTLSTAAAGISTESVRPPTPPASTKWLLIAAPALIAVVALVLLLRKPSAPTAASVPSTANTAESPKTKARLLVKSEPAGAHIWINGEVRSEVTPWTFEDLPLGPIEVKVSMQGYASKTDSVRLTNEGTVTTRNFTLQAASVTFHVGGAPTNATATLDGKSVTLPDFDVAPGEPHTLIVSAPGHHAKTFKINGEVGDDKKLDAAMEKTTSTSVAAKANDRPEKKETASGTGKIMVSAKGGWCNVSIDGKSQGLTPTGAIEISAGHHSVTCTTPEGKTLSSGAKVNNGETARVGFNVGG